MTTPLRPTVRRTAGRSRRRTAARRGALAAAWAIAAVIATVVGTGTVGMLVLVPGWLHGPWEAVSRIGAAPGEGVGSAARLG